MERKITETDLLLYFYKECSEDIQKYISENIEFHSEWQNTLQGYNLLEINLLHKTYSPSSTTLKIILEESIHQENHTF